MPQDIDLSQLGNVALSQSEIMCKTPPRSATPASSSGTSSIADASTLNRGASTSSTAAFLQQGSSDSSKELVTIDESIDECHDCQAGGSQAAGTISDLFRTHRLRLRTINLLFNWFVNALVSTKKIQHAAR